MDNELRCLPGCKECYSYYIYEDDPDLFYSRSAPVCFQEMFDKNDDCCPCMICLVKLTCSFVCGRYLNFWKLSPDLPDDYEIGVEGL